MLFTLRSLIWNWFLCQVAGRSLIFFPFKLSLVLKVLINPFFPFCLLANFRYVCVRIYFLTLFCIFSLFLYHCPIIFMYYKFIISLGRFGNDSPPPLELSFYFSFRTILTLILYCSLWILGLACPFSKKHTTIQKLSCNFVSIYNESIDLFGKNWHQWFRVLRSMHMMDFSAWVFFVSFNKVLCSSS